DVEAVTLHRVERVDSVGGGLDLVGVLVPEHAQRAAHHANDGRLVVDDQHGLGRPRRGDRRGCRDDLRPPTTFRPSRFASYRAWSAVLSSSGTLSVSSGRPATPKLAVSFP